MRVTFYDLLLFFVLALSLGSGCQLGFEAPDESSDSILTTRPLSPPIAPRIEHVHALHGEDRIDPYHWLSEQDNPQVIRYLEEENAYTSAVMAHTKELQEKLYQEMLCRWDSTNEWAHARWGECDYYRRIEPGQSFDCHYLRKRIEGAVEEKILDENELAAGSNFFGLGAFEISPDHRTLMYSVDRTGEERFTVHFQALEGESSYLECIPDTPMGGLVWAADSQSIFYPRLNEIGQSSKIYQHLLGTDPIQDKLIYESQIHGAQCALVSSRSGRFVFLIDAAPESWEWKCLDTQSGDPKFQTLLPRAENTVAHVVHSGNSFFVLTNEDAAHNFEVFEVPVDAPSREHWEKFIAHRSDVIIEKVDAFDDHLVVWERHDRQQLLRVIRLSTGRQHYVELPFEVCTLSLAGNLTYQSDIYRFQCSSFEVPAMTLDYNMNSRELTRVTQARVPGGFDANYYQTEQLMVDVSGGVKVPLLLFYRRGIERSGSNLLLLEGYGAYGVSQKPRFNALRLPLIDRGVIYAIALVRGGGDLGESWHSGGRLLKKKNSFSDFVACAERLIRDGYTNPSRLAISGASEGGLLVGAAVNLRPDLFGAVLADFPSVDILNAMLDDTFWLSAYMQSEFGDPKIPEYYHYIKSYSPYENIRKANYPAMLVRAGFNDTRVKCWEPAKWVARLRSRKTDNNLLLLKTRMDAGHFGSSDIYERIRDYAFQMAFLLETLGRERELGE